MCTIKVSAVSRSAYTDELRAPRIVADMSRHCAVCGDINDVCTAIYPFMTICVATVMDINSVLAVGDIFLQIFTRTIIANANKPQTRSSVLNIVNEVSIPTVRGTQSFDAFVASNARVIDAIVNDCQRQNGSIPIHVPVDDIFTLDVEEGQQRVPAYFTTRVHDVDPTQHLDLQCVASDLFAQVDH